MKKIIKNKKYQGFYLVEAIIALFLITVGLLVTVDLLSSTMKNTFEDRDNIIAVLLAQEGVELVHNLRDNNFAQGKNAFEENFPTNPNNNCRIDKDSTEIDCGTINANFYKLGRDNSGFYSHTGGNATKFQRRIYIQYISTGTPLEQHVKLTSTVIWKGSMASFPIANLDTECTMAAGCAYSQVNLTKWEGE